MARTPSHDASVERMIDVANFCIAFSAYNLWLTQNHQIENHHSKDGIKLFKRYYGALESSLPIYIEPLLQKAPALRSRYNLALTGDVEGRILHCAELFEHFFMWLRSHGHDVGEIFTGRSKRAIQKLTKAATEQSALAKMNQCASIPSISAANALRKWIEVSAEQAGVPLSSNESAMVDSESAVVIAERMQHAETNSTTVDPVSEEAADAEEDKRQLSQELDHITENSKSPQAVLATVTTTLAHNPTSKVAEAAKLNNEQTQAMLATGKVCISAGAGSGKTHTLATKISHLVKEKGYKPSHILATSFTNKSAKELRERVKNLGVPVMDESSRTGARIDTTHSIAHTIIKDFGSRDEQEGAAKAMPTQTATGGQAGSICDRLLGIAIAQVQLTPRSYYTKPDDYKKPFSVDFKDFTWNLGLKPVDEQNKPIGKKRISTAVGNFQSHRISSHEAWAKNKDEKGLNHLAAAVYNAYDWLKKRHPHYSPALDYNDWLNTSVDILERDETAKKAMQDRYKVVMVDESQDLNATQHRLFQHIGEKADTMAYIGDANQAIYEFRGATPKEFISLKDKGFQLKTLARNYRSGKNIVEAANKLITHNNNRIPMVCEANPDRESSGHISAEEVDTHEMAAYRVSEEIDTHLKASIHAQERGAEITHSSPSDFGILVRNNAEKDAYELALISKGIPFRSSGAGYFNREQVKAMTAWMTIASIGSKTSSPDEINEAVLNAHKTPGYYLGEAFKDGLAKACPRGTNYFQFIANDPEEAAKKIYNSSWTERQRPNIIAYGMALREVHDSGADSAYDSVGVIEKILNIKGPTQKSGSAMSFKESLIAMVDPEDIEADETQGNKPTEQMIENAAMSSIRPLMEMAKSQNDPGKFISYIKKMKSANSKTKRNESNGAESPAVRLDTVHQWKGLEAKHVYVNMAGGVFPHHTSDAKAEAGDKEAYDSERRLAYVALTRGQESVKVLSPKQNYLGKNAPPSRFISEACLAVKKHEKPEEDHSEVTASEAFQSAFGSLIAKSVDETISDDGQYLFNM